MIVGPTTYRRSLLHFHNTLDSERVDLSTPSLRLHYRQSAEFDCTPLGYQAVLKNARHIREARMPVERVGHSLELTAIEQPLNISRNSVSSHDQGVVNTVNVATGDRSLRVAEQGRDS